MAPDVATSLPSVSSLVWLLLTLTSTFTFAQNAPSASNNEDGTIVYALFETTRTLTALGTMSVTGPALPDDCFSLSSGRDSTTWYQGCDASGKRSCCPEGYATGGFYTAQTCPPGYTARPTNLDTVIGTPVVYTFSLETRRIIDFCCPTPNPRGGWQEYGFYVEDELVCDWISVNTAASTTVYRRGAASAIVIVPPTTSAGNDPTSPTTSSSTGTNNEPAETSTAPAQSSSGGMSNGAIIGIAVGVGLPVLAIVGFLIYKFAPAKTRQSGANEPGVEEGVGVGGLAY